MSSSENAGHLLDCWITEIQALTQPKETYMCDGSEEERQRLLDLMVNDGMLLKLNEELRPNSYLARSDPSDVARLESSTFICTTHPSDAGPTNNWCAPDIMKAKLTAIMSSCMQDKIMYIIPFVMGRLGDPHSVYGIQLTDSPYVVVNMGIMTKMGAAVMNYIVEHDCPFIRCFHSVCCAHDGSVGTLGQPLSLKWPSNKDKYIVHFPETEEVISLGSGYGGNALLGKKAIALRLASYKGRNEGWFAEHMLLIGLTPDGPEEEGETKYITGAFPSACGKTNLALLRSALPGWKVETLGDDITWLRVEDGILYGMNPETGFFGVAPNTSWDTNPHCMETIAIDAVFTNVALTQEGDVWWDGLTKDVPEGLTDWHGKPYDPNSKSPAAHPNSRFTVSMDYCPIRASHKKNWVPISAILFGGKRKDVVPLVREALSWEHGVYMGSTISSEMTAAAEGRVGELRYDPFAMLPFCGYNMGQYFAHWLSLGTRLHTLPRIFYVNWFKRDERGRFVWPGFSQNIRVLQWIYKRITNPEEEDVKATPIGLLPTNFNLSGLDVDRNALFHVDARKWSDVMSSDEEHLAQFGSDLPNELSIEIDRMTVALAKSMCHSVWQ